MMTIQVGVKQRCGKPGILLLHIYINMLSFKTYLFEAIKPKSISFFDIDETVFNTFAKIIVKDKSTGKEITQLTNQEFNSYKLKDNEEFDFSQFGDAKIFRDTSKVINSVMKRVKEVFSDKSAMVVFLTARADFDSNAMFKDTFRQHGLNVNDTRIRFELTGNLKRGTVPQKKEYVIKKFLDKFKPQEVAIYDDHIDNVKIVDNIKNNYIDINFYKYLIKNIKIIKKK